MHLGLSFGQTAFRPILSGEMLPRTAGPFKWVKNAPELGAHIVGKLLRDNVLS